MNAHVILLPFSLCELYIFDVLAPSGVAFGGPAQTDRNFYHEFEMLPKQRTKAELKQQLDKLPCICGVNWMVMLKQSEMRLNSELMKLSASCSG